MDLQDIFISNLKRFRKELHLTQEKLAELCNTETSYIGQIETRKRFPSLSFIERLAGALNIPAFFLFKPTENLESCMNQEIQKEIIMTISEDISKIFIKHGMI
ncbi:MAG: helix-turn-helix transcriptional regulator [Treponema sp.]|nr:helix-turn-helix transcriptional regulator [Treponema sp.]